MSNPYCSATDFVELYDARQVGMLTKDDNTRTTDTTRLQLLLDIQADRLDSYLAGRYTLPLSFTAQTMPRILMMWVAAKTMERLYQRRNDAPATVKDDVKMADDWLKD